MKVREYGISALDLLEGTVAELESAEDYGAKATTDPK